MNDQNSPARPPEITWAPSDYVDEVALKMRDSPEAWLERRGDGSFAVAPAYEGLQAEPRVPLSDGEIVSFISNTDYGLANLTINADGTWSVDGPMPSDAQQRCVLLGWQWASLADSVEECAASMIEYAAEPADDYPIAYYTSSGPMNFRFDAATTKFERVQ